MTAAIAENLAAIERRIAVACQQAGREADEVRLLPVSKTKPVAAVRAAYAAGYRRFGENRVQEAFTKYEELASTLPDLQWSIIGHLQTNKAKFVAQFASEFQALDSFETAVELEKRLATVDRSLDVLIQVNTSDEPQKFGLAPDQVADFSAKLSALPRLKVKGLMTLALFSDDAALVGNCFQRLVAVQTRLQDRDGGGWQELSMGMSGDFELAIRHGATCVRVGQGIFGSRLNPHEYWPPA